MPTGRRVPRAWMRTCSIAPRTRAGAMAWAALGAAGAADGRRDYDRRRGEWGRCRLAVGGDEAQGLRAETAGLSTMALIEP